eukprot:SM000065S20161  [mRNA]  locus=s65:45001:45851:- [translate_table: standard]
MLLEWSQRSLLGGTNDSHIPDLEGVLQQKWPWEPAKYNWIASWEGAVVEGKGGLEKEQSHATMNWQPNTSYLRGRQDTAKVRGLGPRFHTLIENIACLAYARREDMLQAQMGMPAAYFS